MTALCGSNHTHACLMASSITAIQAAQLTANAVFLTDYPFSNGLPFAPVIDGVIVRLYTCASRIGLLLALMVLVFFAIHIF